MSLLLCFELLVSEVVANNRPLFGSDRQLLEVIGRNMIRTRYGDLRYSLDHHERWGYIVRVLAQAGSCRLGVGDSLGG